MRIGLDIGGTKTHLVALREDNTVMGEVLIPTGFGEAPVIQSTLNAVAQITIGFPGASIESIGVGIPGLVENGVVRGALNLGVTRLDLARELHRELHAPVRVDNDVNAAAIGAFHVFREATMSLTYLNIGTGFAAGVIQDGQLIRGAHGVVGEIGHIAFDKQGPLCTCGQHGCLEAIGSGTAISRLWPSRDGIAPLPSLLDAAASGNEVAARIRDSAIDAIATAIHVLALTTDPQVIALGGGIALFPGVADLVRDELLSRQDRSPFITSLNLNERVHPIPVDQPIPALGAALLFGT